jgi:hypothetical protein
MVGEADQTLLTVGDTTASDPKAATGTESDTVVTSSSSNAPTRTIVKKATPMLYEYWKKSTVTKADCTAYHTRRLAGMWGRIFHL